MYKRREIAVDLTSLLDVILIILFMLVVNMSKQATGATTTANEELDSTKEQLETLESDYNDLQRKVTSNQVLDNTCMVVTISIQSDEEKTTRTLTIEREDDEDVVVEYDWDNLTYAKNSLKTKLNEEFTKLEDIEQMVLFVFQYDSDTIFNADYKFVDSVLKDVQKSDDKIYITYFDQSEQKAQVQTREETTETYIDKDNSETTETYIDKDNSETTETYIDEDTSSTDDIQE